MPGKLAQDRAAFAHPRREARCSGGYTTSTPHPSTAIALLSLRAPLHVRRHRPLVASPLTTVSPETASSRPSRRAIASPAGVGAAQPRWRHTDDAGLDVPGEPEQNRRVGDFSRRRGYASAHRHHGRAAGGAALSARSPAPGLGDARGLLIEGHADCRSQLHQQPVARHGYLRRRGRPRIALSALGALVSRPSRRSDSATVCAGSVKCPERATIYEKLQSACQQVRRADPVSRKSGIYNATRQPSCTNCHGLARNRKVDPAVSQIRLYSWGWRPSWRFGLNGEWQSCSPCSWRVWPRLRSPIGGPRQPRSVRLGCGATWALVEAANHWQKAVELDPTYRRPGTISGLRTSSRASSTRHEPREKAVQLEPNNDLIRQSYDSFREIYDRQNRRQGR